MDKSLLMRSPFHPAAVIAVYLFVVLKLGPNLMKNRQPFDLKKLIVIYNLSQIIINTILFFKGIKITLQTKIICAPVDETDLRVLPEILDLHYTYMMLKLYDFLETIFFVLRKKQRQVSFLHLFHHVGTFLFVWFCGKYLPVSEVLPAGPSLTLLNLNTFVHVFMYMYYFLSSVDVAVDLRWKKYLTLLQLTQQILLFVTNFFGFVDPECPYPNSVKIWAGLFVFGQIYLFASFYYKTYVVNKNR